jgi:hypothetical protein
VDLNAMSFTVDLPRVAPDEMRRRAETFMKQQALPKTA